MSTGVDGDLLLLGKGKVYFDRLNSSGVKTGERFLGNCTTLEITTTDENREKYSSATQDSPLMKRVNVRRLVELSLVLDHFSMDNIALALMGEVSALAQGASTVTDELIDPVVQGRYYKLAFRKVSSVVVTSNPAGTTYVVDDDYTVDATTGRIYIVPGGAIADGTDLLVDYSYAADTSVTVRGGKANLIQGFVRFIGDPAAGPVQELEVWSVSSSPDGPIGFISDDYAEFTLKMAVQSDATNHPDEPLYRLIERSE